MSVAPRRGVLTNLSAVSPVEGRGDRVDVTVVLPLLAGERDIATHTDNALMDVPEAAF